MLVRSKENKIVALTTTSSHYECVSFFSVFFTKYHKVRINTEPNFANKWDFKVE